MALRILLVLAFAAAGHGATLAERITAFESKIDLAARMKALKVPGVSIAVIDNFAIDWARSYGVRDEAGQPVNLETLFQAASISKPVAATAVMKLVEQGKLKLDEDVNVKLKSWKVPENEFTATEKVTLRRIMSHSAGLTVHGFPGYEEGAPLPTVPQILDGLKPANTAAVRVDIVPGSKNRYSGGGTTVLQLLVADVTGRRFADVLRDLVLSKAGMKDSTYEQPLPPAHRGNAATAFKSDGSPVKGRYHTYPEQAAAGLWTTPSDLARLLIEIGKSAEGQSNKILAKETVREMLKPEKPGAGLGFALNPDATLFGHGGSNAGFRALMFCSRSGRGFVVMTNSDSGGRLAGEIQEAIAGAYGWAEFKRQ